MAKSIFIFNDGTGQNINSRYLSNVAKIYLALPGKDVGLMKSDLYKFDPKLNYHSLFYRGIGTRDLRVKNKATPGQTKLKRFFSYIKLKAQLGGDVVTGVSIKERVEAVLFDLEQLWQKGDKVYFVGFSRGASSVRIAAALFKELRPEFEIEYMLIYDTVYSVLKPVKIRTFPVIENFDDRTIGLHVKKCDHLISGDEMRNMFPLTPVNLREGVRQILFSGSHSDVGGSAFHNFLSDFSLKFSLEEFRNLGIEFNAKKIKDFKIAPNCAAEVGWDLFYGTGQTHFPRDLRGLEFQVHHSVFERSNAGKPAPVALVQLVTLKTKSTEVLIHLHEIESSWGVVDLEAAI